MKARQDTTKDESISPTPPLEQKINHNGFTNSPPFTQILPPLVVILALILTLVSTNVYFAGTWILIIFDLALLIDCCLVVWLWYLSTSIVPTDGVQLRHLAAIEQGKQFDHSNLTYFCHTCKTYINNNCFHCKRCRRCVQFFDHHCKWLNNCIGAKNYFEFYGLIVTTFVLLGMCIGLSAVCLSHKDKEESVVLICSIITILLAAVPCCWLMYLFCLHTYLIITKKSTIQLILESRTRHRVTPKNHNNQVFKVSFSKNSTDPAVKKVVFPDRDEDTENSHTQTNQNLIRPKERYLGDSIDIQAKKDRSLPPLRSKINVNFVDYRLNNTLVPYSLSPPIIKR